MTIEVISKWKTIDIIQTRKGISGSFMAEEVFIFWEWQENKENTKKIDKDEMYKG